LPLLPGSTLATYQILGAIGAGAMGEVYRAKDTRLGREVAIKVLPEHFADDAERLKRFEREARTLASLNHPNVAQIHGVDQVGDTCFLVLELVPGESLEERLKRGPLPVAETLEVCRQIADGLEAAHEAGVIHRDLKPANIRLTPDGKVKVLDFGLAKPAREAGDSQSSTDSVLSTEAGRLLGTPTYMSPEQARGKPIDRRVDIWAFGCIVYECLTGKRAFAGETLTDVFAAVIEREPDWTRLPGSTPPRLHELLRGCLVKDSRQRLHDIGDARLELERAIAEHGQPGGASGGRERTAWRPLVLCGILGFALGALAARWTPLSREAGERPPSPGALRLSITLPETPQATGTMTLSPDGRTLAYTALAKDQAGDTLPQIWLRRIDSFQSILLAGTDGASSMCFSPDGTWMAFVRSIPGSSDEGSRLEKISLSGGPPITLYEDRVRSCGTPIWVEPGSIEFIRRTPTPEVATISSDGGEPRRRIEIPEVNQGGFLSNAPPTAIPGSDMMLVSLPVTDAKGWRVRTHLISPSSPPRVLIDDGAFAQCVPPGVVVYASGDTLLARRLDPRTCDWVGGPVPVLSGLRTTQGYASRWWSLSASSLAYVPGGRITGKRRLAKMDRSGKIEPFPNAVGDFEASAVPSPDGTMIAGQWATPDGNYELYVYDVKGGTIRRLPVRGADCSQPVWSRDGKYLYHGLFVTGQPSRITVRRADGTDSPRTICELPVDEKVAIPAGELIDGKHLVVAGGRSQPEGSVKLLVLSVDGTDKPVQLLEGLSYQVLPRISPDGKCLLYGQVEDGTSELVLRSISWSAGQERPKAGGERAVVQIGGFVQASWSPDGRKIVYAERNSRLLEVDVTTEPTVSVSPPHELAKLDPTEMETSPVSLPGTDELVFVQDSSEESRITQVNVVLNWYEELQSRIPIALGR
jgi:Tol biopolymer transport system component/tRNA A-37 threonylcarbamoyl transferase component Bud32